jgi:SAM-dependent methyltransferase
MIMKNCNICNAELEHAFTAKEMMLGLRHEFLYAQCTACKTIQIVDIPQTMDTYYPAYYYSFQHAIMPLVRLPFIKRLFPNFRIKKRYRKNYSGIFKHFKPLNILPAHKILDIGCGTGKLVCEMFNLGFTNIQGIDKYIDREYDYGYGVKIFKKDLDQLKQGNFDLLMMHHVFEHMDDPYTEFSKSNRLLKKNGHLLVRIPIVAKAWEIYQQNWVQLDAPRHFFLHTIASIQILTEKTGFIVDDIVYDSTSFQFWGSELYKRDVSLFDQDTKKYIEAKDFFTDEELHKYNEMAEELNNNKQGDQAVFYLRKQ